MIRTREHLAWHVAGHAYAATMCGFPVQSSASWARREVVYFLSGAKAIFQKNIIHSKIPTNFLLGSRVILVTAVAFIVDDQQFQEETTSKVLRIMMFSLLMSDCRQSDMKWFAIPANVFATQPVRPQIRPQFGSNPGHTGLRSEESTYPLRS